jgi:hypothetical protein
MLTVNLICIHISTFLAFTLKVELAMEAILVVIEKQFVMFALEYMKMKSIRLH